MIVMQEMNDIDVSLYEQARHKMVEGKDISKFFLNFLAEDVVLIERVILAVQALLEREDLSPAYISAISKVLLGLRRLPLKTPGLDVQFELFEEGEGGSNAYTLYLTEDSFELSSGGFIDFPGGSDSFSGPSFLVEEHFRDDVNIYDIAWPAIFREWAKDAKLLIEDESEDSDLEWQNDDGTIFWEWIADHEVGGGSQYQDWMSDNDAGSTRD